MTCLPLLVAAVVTLAQADVSGHMPRVRPLGDDARQLLVDAQARSGIIRTLLARLDDSDVIVYLQRAVLDRPTVEGRTSLITAVPEARFVRVVIRTGLTKDRAIEMFAHELQHVLEIAVESRIRSQASLLQYLRVIGFEFGPSRFETEAALKVERAVGIELQRTSLLCFSTHPTIRLSTEPIRARLHSRH